MKFDDLSKKVIGCALEIHKELGPGLLENAYKQCLAFYMKLTKIKTGLLINFNEYLLRQGIKRYVL